MLIWEEEEKSDESIKIKKGDAPHFIHTAGKWEVSLFLKHAYRTACTRIRKPGCVIKSPARLSGASVFRDFISGNRRVFSFLP